MALNLGTILASSAREHPERTALIAEGSLSSAELDRAARVTAALLLARGVRPGAAVALLLPNVPEFTIAYFGALYAGAVVVPLNVLLTAPEIAYALQDSEAVLLVAHALFAASAEPGASGAAVPV